jgi:hypothetical protein
MSDIKDIIGIIAKEPGLSLYKIAKKTKIPRTNVMRALKIEDFSGKRGLVGFECVKLEHGPRNAEPAFLTFKGILYALDVGAIKPEDAAKDRQLNKAEVPNKPERSEMDRLFGLSSASPFSHGELESVESLFPSNLINVFQQEKQRAKQMVAETEVIRAKSGNKELKLFQAIERRYSSQIYGTLLKTISISHYDPFFVGYHYHSLMDLYRNDFMRNVFIDRKAEFIEEYVDGLRDDPVEIEVQQKAFLPYMAANPLLPQRIRDTFLQLSKIPPDELCDRLRKFLEVKYRQKS